MTAEPGPVPSLRNWAFAAYSGPGVQEACLDLQDRHGMDVVTLLWCIWAGEHHGAIDADVIGRIVAETAAWQAEVVAPLRAVRRRLKQADAAALSGAGEPAVAGASVTPDTKERLRSQVADAELAAEVIQLDRLESSTLAAPAGQETAGASTVAGPPGEAAVQANLASLIALGGPVADPGCGAAVAALLAALAGSGS